MQCIDIFYQGELVRDMDHLEADVEHTLGAVKALIIAKHGGAGDMFIFLEDSEEPLDEGSTAVALAGPAGLKVHLHRCRHIEVAVTFAGEMVHRTFAPSTTVARVKAWAAQHKFGMTEEEAGEHVLQLVGTHDRPAPGVHIGTLATCPACRVAFDLVPDERVNGASNDEHDSGVA